MVQTGMVRSKTILLIRQDVIGLRPVGKSSIENFGTLRTTLCRAIPLYLAGFLGSGVFGFKIGWTSAENHFKGTIAALRLQGCIF